MKKIQILIIFIVGLVVSYPFMMRIIEREQYQSLASKIVAYIDDIREKGGNCRINIGQEEINSNCGESMALPKHIVVEPLTINYENKILSQEPARLVISSVRYPEQYCIGFDGLLIRAGYYDGQCHSLIE